MSIVSRARAGGAAVGRAFASPALYIVALATLALIAAAYQVRPGYHLTIGGPTDRPFVESIHEAENDPNLGRRYRWTQPDSIVKLPGIGQQDLAVQLEWSGARPAGYPPPTVEVYADTSDPTHPEVLLGRVQPGPEVGQAGFGVPGNLMQANGDLRLTIRTTNPFTPTGDPRVLGVRLFAADVTPTTVGVPHTITPPLAQVAPLLAAALLCTLTLLLLGWGGGGAAAGGLLWSLGTAAFLLGDRPWLTSFSWALPQAWIIALLTTLALAPLVAALYRWAGITWPRADRRALLTIFALAIVARLGGQLHPEIFIPDLGFHANRFIEVLNGNLLFTIYSAEWGNHRTFYLPTVYVFMAPLQWIFNERFLTVRVFTVLLDTTSIFMLYYLARRALGSGRAGLWAAILFVTLPQAVLVFSWGITANVFAQWTMLAVITVLLAGYERLNHPLVWLGLVITMYLALMSHPGTVQLTAVLLALTAVLWLALRGRVGALRSWWLTGAALGVAAGLAYVTYYTNWVTLELTELQAIMAERAQQAGGAFRARVGGSVNDLSLGLFSYAVATRQAQVWEGLAGFWKEAWAYYKTLPLIWTALGLLAAGPATPILRRLRTLSAAWAATAVLFAFVGLFANLYVRYMLFLLPLVALGSGALLEWLRRRGPAGRLLLALVLAGFVVNALALWWWRIEFYLK